MKSNGLGTLATWEDLPGELHEHVMEQAYTGGSLSEGAKAIANLEQTSKRVQNTLINHNRLHSQYAKVKALMSWVIEQTPETLQEFDSDHAPALASFT